MENFIIGEACISSVYIKEDGFKDYRFAAYRAAEDSGFRVVRNPEDTGITQTRFVNILKQHTPVFILLIGEEKSDVVTDECSIALERGLPVFTFLKVKTTEENKTNGRETKSISGKTRTIMKKISQMTFDSDCALFSSCEELYSAVRYRLKIYIEQKIGQRPKIQNNKGSTYYYAYEQILAAKKRIILSQKTSLLILGPRRGNTYERRTYDAILEWIRKKDSDMQFMHLFCKAETLADMKKADASKEYDIETAKSKLSALFEEIKKKNNEAADPNVTFRFIEKDENSVAHLITDTGFQLVLPIAGDIFNLILPYYLTPEEQLMKIITRIHTREFIGYDDVKKLYDEAGI